MGDMARRPAALVCGIDGSGDDDGSDRHVAIRHPRAVMEGVACPCGHTAAVEDGVSWTLLPRVIWLLLGLMKWIRGGGEESACGAAAVGCDGMGNERGCRRRKGS